MKNIITTILFDKFLWDIKSAKKWLRKKGYTWYTLEVPPSGKNIRFIVTPEEKIKGRFKYITFGKGIKALEAFRQPRKNPFYGESFYKMYKKVARLYNRFEEIETMVGFPLHTVELIYCTQADREHQEVSRRFAHTAHHPMTICFSRALLDMPKAVQYGILAHEFGHIIQERYDLPYDEMGADMLIEQYAGIKIIYKNTIQHAYL